MCVVFLSFFLSKSTETQKKKYTECARVRVYLFVLSSFFLFQFYFAKRFLMTGNNVNWFDFYGMFFDGLSAYADLVSFVCLFY